MVAEGVPAYVGALASSVTMPVATTVSSQKNIVQTPLEQWPSRPSSAKLPVGSLNTKVIITSGEIVERIYKAPNGQLISIFPNSLSDNAA